MQEEGQGKEGQGKEGQEEVVQEAAVREEMQEKELWKNAGGRCREVSAYMTTEASMILPLAVGLIVLILYLGFYLYAVCFLNQTAYIAAFRGSQNRTGRMRETTEAELHQLMEGRLLPIRNLKQEIAVSPLAVTVKLEADLNIPFAGILPTEQTVWQIRAEKRAAIRSAAAYIRLARSGE